MNLKPPPFTNFVCACKATASHGRNWRLISGVLKGDTYTIFTTKTGADERVLVGKNIQSAVHVQRAPVGAESAECGACQQRHDAAAKLQAARASGTATASNLKRQAEGDDESRDDSKRMALGLISPPLGERQGEGDYESRDESKRVTLGPLSSPVGEPQLHSFSAPEKRTVLRNGTVMGRQPHFSCGDIGRTVDSLQGARVRELMGELKDTKLVVAQKTAELESAVSLVSKQVCVIDKLTNTNSDLSAHAHAGRAVARQGMLSLAQGASSLDDATFAGLAESVAGGMQLS